MTRAVCFSCGAIKIGAFVPCRECSGVPETEEELVLSLAMTDHYFDTATLDQMGASVRHGKPPHLDRESYAEFAELLRRTGALAQVKGTTVEGASDAAGAAFQFRVTKYDPSFRDADGYYFREEWTGFRDIGESFDDGVLTREEYERVESAYVAAAQDMLLESGVESLTFHAWMFGQPRRWGLGRRRRRQPADRATVRVAELAEIIRAGLREEYYFELEGKGAFVHFGYDFYMWVGTPRYPTYAIERAVASGLYVEPMRSPYSPGEDPFGQGH